MSQESTLLLVWVTFTVVALVGIMAVFLWAVRSRQFSDQDRARYLPLRSGTAPDDEPAADAASVGGPGVMSDEGRNHVPT
jgi:cbb3-type cytochrome oxidase maturation protein